MKGNATILPLRQTLPLLAIYLLVSIPAMYHHALWLDEAQHFLIGRDSDSLGALYQNMRYDGHPRLWNFLLFFVAHYISPSYAGMQVLHLTITTLALFVFLRYAPFPLWMKVLILGGYYFLFEYNLLSRNYALGILLLFCCCRLLEDPRKNRWWLGLVLLLQCNTHLFFCFAAIGICLYLLADREQVDVWLTPVIAGCLVGVVTAGLQTMVPPEDSPYVLRPAQWLTAQNTGFAAAALVKGWLPVPGLGTDRFWNTWWVDSWSGFWRWVGFLFFLLFPAGFLWNRWRVLLIYYSSLFMLLGFFTVMAMSGARYFGMAYIYFLAACWIAGGDVFAWRAGQGRYRAGMQVFLLLVLGIQVLTGIYAVTDSFRRPFSESWDTVQYLTRHGLDGQRIVVDGYNGGPVLSAYLGRAVYYLDIGQEGSYCYFRKSFFPVVRPAVGVEIGRARDLQGLDKFILVSNRPVGQDSIHTGQHDYQLSLLQSFGRSMILSENYFIYQVWRTN